MFKFIRYFIMEWRYYPMLMAFWDSRPKLQSELKEKGEWFPKSRFDYALKTAKVHYKHRDRYGRKCRKFAGNCERCNAKHC